MALRVPTAFSDELIVRSLQRQRSREIYAQKEAAKVAYPGDPVGFFRHVLGWEAWSLQRAIAGSVVENRHTFVKKCHASGGTALMARLALWFLYAWPDDSTAVLTTAPTGRQVEELLWRELRTAWHGSKVALPGRLYEGRTKLNLSGSQYCIGFAAKDASGVPGFHAKRVLVLKDEAAGIEKPITDAIESALAGGDTMRMVEMSQPIKADGHFYDAFNKNKKVYGDSALFTISYDQTPNFTGEMAISSLISQDWVEERGEVWGTDSPIYGVRCLAKFPPLGMRQLISPEWIERARNKQAFEVEQGPLVLGIDVAGLGRNATVIYPRSGNWFYPAITLQQQDPITIVGYIVQVYRKWHPAVIAIDATGIGQGTYYRLKEVLKPELDRKEVRIIPLIVGGKASNQRDYENLGSELYGRVSDKLRGGDLGGSIDEDTESDLIRAQSMPPTSSGRLRIDKYGDGDESPDHGDAFVYTEACRMVLQGATARLEEVA